MLVVVSVSSVQHPTSFPNHALGHLKTKDEEDGDNLISASLFPLHWDLD